MILNIFVFLFLQLFFGEKLSIPYGLMTGISFITMFLIIFVSDIFLIFIAYQAIFWSKEQLGHLRFINNLVCKYENFLMKYNLIEKFVIMGKIGMMLITAIPFLGGVWSGVILGHISYQKKNAIFLWVGIGSLFSAMIYVLLAMGVIRFIEVF